MVTLRTVIGIIAALAVFAVESTVYCASTVPSGGQAQSGSGEWQRYRVDGEEFSVLLPVVPAMSTSSITMEEYPILRKRRQRILGAYADGVVYVIHTFEKKKISVEKLIKSAIPDQTTELAIVDGIAGKRSRTEDSNRVRILEFFATGRNIYVFEAVGSKLGDPSAGISRFLSSISFQKGSDSRTVEEGPGDQPISNANSAVDSAISFKEATLEPKAIIKPEPRYTEAARRNQVVGTVVLRAVLSSSGAVENITVDKGLPDGLTERAIKAARQIRFIPGIKDGRFVSVKMQLEYNFNLY